MSTRSASLFASIPVLAALAACGGATAPLVDLGGNDAGPSSDAGHPLDAGGREPCPSPVAYAVGTSCTQEGQTCSDVCPDTCSFCSLIVCNQGRWTEGESSPSGKCVPDAGPPPRRWPSARLSWQSASGVAGKGPALIVGGDGLVRVWSFIAPFDPAAIPPESPDTSVHLTGAQVDDLFDRWTATDTASLPHADFPFDCLAAVQETSCPTCTPTTIDYRGTPAVTPEMGSVWAWFSVLKGIDGGDPSQYCLGSVAGLTPDGARATPH